jgi:RNA:NAD 2'-phosphotransferase (TPT1/KptA family)
MVKSTYVQPKNIPPELFHGTSLSRWRLINGHGLLTNRHKIYRDIQDEDNRIYLTIDSDNAAYYGLKTTEMEKRLSEKELKETGISKRKNDALIISIDTSGLKKESLYFDPEDVHHKGWYVYFGNIPPNLIKKLGVTNIQHAPESEKIRLFSDIEFGEALENKNEKKFVDVLEIHIIKSKELGLEFNLLEQLTAIKNHDKIATKGKFFSKIENELIKREILQKSQIKNI